MQAPAAAATPEVFKVEAIAALALVALVALAISLVVGSLTRRLLLAIEGERLHTQPIARTTVKVLQRITFILSMLVLTFPALDMAGINLTVGLHPEELTRWLAESGARVLLLLLLAYAANRFAGSVIRNAVLDVDMGDDRRTFERRKRVQTVGATLRRFFSILIWSAALLMILRELDIDITPVLTGAGIVGLAIGFGAQSLVKDIIAGLFVIAEDQVRIGDAAQINGINGTVEEINLRTTVLRDVEGAVHIIGNGEIRTLANKSRDFAYYVIDIPAGYYDDTDHMVTVVRDVARELMQEPEYAACILEPLEVMGVDAFKPAEVTLRFRIKTLPLRQGDVGRELRRRIKRAFDANRIHLPVPQYQITVKGDTGIASSNPPERSNNTSI